MLNVFPAITNEQGSQPPCVLFPRVPCHAFVCIGFSSVSQQRVHSPTVSKLLRGHPLSIHFDRRFKSTFYPNLRQTWVQVIENSKRKRRGLRIRPFLFVCCCFLFFVSLVEHTIYLFSHFIENTEHEKPAPRLQYPLHTKQFRVGAARMGGGFHNNHDNAHTTRTGCLLSAARHKQEGIWA